MGIFNKDSDEEENEKRNDSPLKFVNGKLKGLSPFKDKEREKPKKAPLFTDSDDDGENRNLNDEIVVVNHNPSKTMQSQKAK